MLSYSRKNATNIRKILDSIHDGSLNNVEFEKVPVFNFDIPKSCPGVDSSILMPKNTWSDKAAYDTELKKLAEKFIENFKKFESGVPKEVVQNGGPRL